MSERGSAPAAENKMGTMPVGKLVFNMSLPMMVSMLVQALYNIYPFIAQSLLPLHYYKTATLPTNTRTDLLI